MEISLCMIVKDEEDVLARCLSSVKDIVKEIIIVDTGSSDQTKKIAKEFTSKIYDMQWEDNFAKARNFSFSKATKDYILWLDADDFFNEENHHKFKEMVQIEKPSSDIINMIYSLHRDQKGKTIHSLRRNRIVKREKNFQWIGRVHEYLDCAGSYHYADIEVFHGKHKVHTGRNLKIFEKMKEDHVDFSPRDMYYYANELYDHAKHEEAIVMYRKFLDTKLGWIEDRKGAILKSLICLDVLKRQSERPKLIFECMEWGSPSAELLCRLAEHFMFLKQWKDAAYWYKAAMQTIPEQQQLSFQSKEYYTFVPAIQICVCYSQLGDYEKAYEYNEMAAYFNPNNSKVVHNRIFLTDMIRKENES